MIAVDGVRAPASGTARRLLRRGLLVAALAGAGWLLTALFATSASAAPVPPTPPVEDASQVVDARPDLPDQAPDPVQTPATEHVPTAAHVPTAEQMPTTEQGLATDPVPAAVNAPVTEPGSATENAPVAEQVPVAEQPVADQVPVAEQPVAEQEQAGADQMPVLEPVQQQPPLATPMAAPAPNQPHSGGLLGGLLGGITNTVGTLTQSVVGVVDGAVSALPAVIVPDADTPIVSLPVSLPDILTVDESGIRTEVPAPPAPTPARPATPPAATVPEHTTRQATFGAPPPPEYGKTGVTERTAARHVDKSPEPQPVKVPAAPVGGSIAATTYDNSGGVRGTLGVLSVRTPLQPPAAGFTTRSRAVDVSGRATGLPATSPD